MVSQQSGSWTRCGRVKNQVTAIHPFETMNWAVFGLYQARRLSVTTSFEWISEYSIHALTWPKAGYGCKHNVPASEWRLMLSIEGH